MRMGISLVILGECGGVVDTGQEAGKGQHVKAGGSARFQFSTAIPTTSRTRGQFAQNWTVCQPGCHLDLYYIHGPDPVTPFEETLRAYDDLVRQGKVRYIGCSNIFGWQIAKAAGISARLNLERLVAGQYIYSLIHRELEREIIPAAIDSGLGITALGAVFQDPDR
jgi:hypothetical protein